MVTRFEPAAAVPLGVDQFYEAVEACSHDRFTNAHVAEMSRLLQGLAANRTLIVEDMEQRRPWLGSADRKMTVQYYALADRSTKYGRFILRVCFWLPRAAIPNVADQDAFAYEIAHNHDFRFLTVGLFGPGYGTRTATISEADAARPQGIIESMSEIGFTRLDPGSVLYFRPGVDVHSQGFPESISVSLNLIMETACPDVVQSCFDLDGRTATSERSSGFAALREESMRRFAADFL